MENKNALSLLNIRYSYDKSIEILHGITASFKEGKIIGLIGANGCGKSTLLNLIAGVLKPDSGEIWIRSEKLRDMKRTTRAKHIAVVHQSNTAPCDITVEKLVSTGRTPYRSLLDSFDKNGEKIIQKALEDTATTELVNKQISTLSGGQLQRVWLAMALAQDTDILLLDEITTYLDVHYQMEIMHLIKEINEKKNITIIMVLHDINLALEFCDEIVVMKDGLIVSQGSAEDAISENILNDAFEVSSKIIQIGEKKHCIFARGGGLNDI